MEPAFLPARLNFPFSAEALEEREPWPMEVRIRYQNGSVFNLTDVMSSTTICVESGLAALCLARPGERLTCVGFIGAGGIVGPELNMLAQAGCTAVCRAVGQLEVIRIPASLFQQAVDQSADLRASYLLQTQRRMVQVQQVAVCNVRHPLGARCTHWMLVLQHRLGNVLPLTHEFLATVLGVRRAGVGVTLQALQRSGVIRQDRGSIVIRDFERLQDAACLCPIIEETPVDLGRWISPREDTFATKGMPGVRGRIEAATRNRGLNVIGTERELARRQATLDVCRAVITQTKALLSDHHS